MVGPNALRRIILGHIWVLRVDAKEMFFAVVVTRSVMTGTGSIRGNTKLPLIGYKYGGGLKGSFFPILLPFCSLYLKRFSASFVVFWYTL